MTASTVRRVLRCCEAKANEVVPTIRLATSRKTVFIEGPDAASAASDCIIRLKAHGHIVFGVAWQSLEGR